MRACAATSWLPSLAVARPRVVFPHALIPLTPDFVAWLESDGMGLPDAPESLPPSPADPRHGRPAPPPAAVRDDGSPPSPSARRWCFPDVESALTEAIARFGGEGSREDGGGGLVFVKLSWSAPMDAGWAMPDGMCACATPGHVFKLLKASDLAQYDVDAWKRASAVAAGDATLPPLPLALVVRPWYHVHLSREWRVFIAERGVVAICQRHVDHVFPHLADAAAQAEVSSLLEPLCVGVVAPAVPLRDFVVDAYVDRRGRAWVIDVAPWGGDTDPLLFTWEELEAHRCGGCKEGGIRVPEGAEWTPACEHAGLDPAAAMGGAAAAPPHVAAIPVRIVEAGAAAAHVPSRKLGAHAYPDDLLRLAHEEGGLIGALQRLVASAAAGSGSDSDDGGDAAAPTGR